MDHNYVRDEENEEEILRGIWENAHPDAGGEDASDGTNAGDGTNVGGGTEQTGQEDDDDFTLQFLIGGEGLESTQRRGDKVYIKTILLIIRCIYGFVLQLLTHYFSFSPPDRANLLNREVLEAVAKG